MNDADISFEQLLAENKKLKRQVDKSAKLEKSLKAINQQLISKEKFLNSLVDQSPFATWISDSKGTLLHANPALKKFLNVTDDQIVGKYNVFEDKIVIKEGLIPLISTVFKNGKTVTFTLEWDNKDMPMMAMNGYKSIILEGTMFPVHNYNGKLTNVVLIWIDITERRKAKAARIESQKNLIQAQYIAGMGDFSWDIETGKVTCSDGMYRLLKYDKDEIIDFKKINKDIHHPDDLKDITSWLKNSIESGEEKLTPNEYRLICKDGEIIFVHTNGRIEYNNNRAVKVFGTCLNITELKMAEKNLKAALEQAQESDRLKSAFLVNMSHEIRTPMNGILGFVDLLNTPELSDSKRTEFTNIINMSSGRLLNTINNLIDLSKIEAGQVKISNSMICLNKLFNELYVFFDREVKAKGLSLISSPPENQITIFTDNDKLNGILVNLIKNAIKYTEKGSITFGYNIKNDFIEFFVEDSGIGVPEYKQKAIFGRFVQADTGDTRAFEGFGLGLSIAQAYVEMLGGEIWMKSTEGKGTKFIFTIPAIFGENKQNASDQKISELLSAKKTFVN